MPFYSLFNILYGYLKQDENVIQLLQQHKFYFIPVVNVDGSHDIEELGLEHIRKNRNPSYSDCPDEPDRIGVDLNRNYAFAFGTSPGAS